MTMATARQKTNAVGDLRSAVRFIGKCVFDMDILLTTNPRLAGPDRNHFLFKLRAARGVADLAVSACSRF